MLRYWGRENGIHLVLLSHRDAGIVLPALLRAAAESIPEDELMRDTECSASGLSKTADDFRAIVQDDLSVDPGNMNLPWPVNWTSWKRIEPGSRLSADVYLGGDSILLGVDQQKLTALVWIMCRLAADFDDASFLEKLGCSKTEVLSLALDAQLLLEVLQACED